MIARARAALLASLAAWVGAWWAFACERARMRLSAALMDAGAYLALDPVERRARRLRRRMLGRRGRRLGPYAALLRMGAKPLAGEATLALATRATASGRVLSLLCVAVREGGGPSDLPRPCPRPLPEDLAGAAGFYWAVRSAPADGRPGGARTSMLHEREGALEKALIAFFADPVPGGLAGLRRAEHHEPAGEGLDRGQGRVPDGGEAPAA